MLRATFVLISAIMALAFITLLTTEIYCSNLSPPHNPKYKPDIMNFEWYTEKILCFERFPAKIRDI